MVDGMALCGFACLNRRLAVKILARASKPEQLCSSSKFLSALGFQPCTAALQPWIMTANPGIYLCVAFTWLWGIILQFYREPRKPQIHLCFYYMLRFTAL